MSQMYGYAGNILRVDLSTGTVSNIPTENYTDKFLGGRGIAVKIHWDEVPAAVKAFDPENRLVFMTGPLCCVHGFASSRWQVSGKSPIHNQFSYCNLGGTWGYQLKSAGYDGLIVHGKADSLVYLVIENGKVELKNASYLKGKGAIDTRQILQEEIGKSFCVAAIGAAGENMVHFATLTSDLDSSGSGGLGAVMGSKNLKAIAVSGNNKFEVADNERVQLLRKRVKELRPPFADWPVMLPKERVKKEICKGCTGCFRSTYTAEDGQVGKYICQSAFYYEVRSMRYYGEPSEVSFKATKLCDNYGMDTRAVETLIMWLVRCYKAGIITEDECGVPFTKLGSLEFIETLLRKISFRTGFCDLLAEGTLKAAENIGQGSEKFITDYMTKTGENSIYGARLYLTTGLFYAMEPRLPIQMLHEVSMQGMMWAARVSQTGHVLGDSSSENYMTSDVIRAIGKRFWGDEICADFSTYDGKAMAAARIQDRQFAKECLVLCDFAWPIYHTPATEDHVGDPSLESQICSAVTGRDIDEIELYKIAERVWNLKRAILTREGRKGRIDDNIEEFNFTVPLKGDFGNPKCIVPGKDGEVFSREGMVVDKTEFEKMKDEYYSIRGWDVETGFQTRLKLDELGLAEVADELELRGLVK